jgi:hypothetical protein
MLGGVKGRTIITTTMATVIQMVIIRIGKDMIRKWIMSEIKSLPTTP